MTQYHRSTGCKARVPNGVAKQRLRVALPDNLLESIKRDADQQMRTVSSMAALIIAEHYEAELTGVNRGQ